MKTAFRFLFCLFFIVPAFYGHAQTSFNNCAAAFLNKKMVVDEYTTTGKCVLPATATGELTVCTADLSPELSIPKDKIEFKIAIRDKNTGTLTMYSGDTYRKVDIRKVLAQCKSGDHIVLLTMDREFALPHNEILVQ